MATNGAASTATVSLSGTFDLSAFTEAANDLSDFDTLVLGFARKINGATTPAASISNVKLWPNSKGEDEVPFEKWATDLALTSAAAVDDPDGDGLSNFREFALGGNPTQSTSTGVRPFQRKVQDGGSEYLEFVYRRRVRSDNTLNYILQTSTDLSPDSWTDSGFVELPALDTEDPDFQEITSRLDTSSAPKAFMRLRIQAPE